jgi:hypothetical protein
MVAHTCNPSYMGIIDRRIVNCGCPWPKKVKILSKNSWGTKGLGVKMPAQQVQCPEFKPLFCWKNFSLKGQSVMAHAYKSTYLGGRDRSFVVQGQWGKRVSKILSQRTSQAGWHTSLIPAMQEAEVGGSQSESSPGKKCEAYLKNS